MRIGVLGTFEVTDDEGRELALGDLEQWTVLTALLRRRGQVVSIERINELWESARGRPGEGRAGVRVESSCTLGDWVLVACPSGYVVQTERVEIDLAVRFEKLAPSSRRALASADPQSGGVVAQRVSAVTLPGSPGLRV